MKHTPESVRELVAALNRDAKFLSTSIIAATFIAGENSGRAATMLSDLLAENERLNALADQLARNANETLDRAVAHFGEVNRLSAENERMREAAGRICQFIAFIEADAEINDETIKDTATLLSFMGSGASDSLTMGDFRNLRAALTPESKE